MIFSLHNTLRFGDQVSQSVKKSTACSVYFFFNLYNMIFYGLICMSMCQKEKAQNTI